MLIFATLVFEKVDDCVWIRRRLLITNETFIWRSNYLTRGRFLIQYYIIPLITTFCTIQRWDIQGNANEAFRYAFCIHKGTLEKGNLTQWNMQVFLKVYFHYCEQAVIFIIIMSHKQSVWRSWYCLHFFMII